MDQLTGSLKLQLGQEGEEYLGLNGRMNSLENLLVLSDEQGAFGSPFVDSS